MITTPTCLVLGAGASAPYRFPVGVELRNQIARLTGKEYQVMTDSGFPVEEVKAFAHALSRSGYGSVDWFLADFPDFIPVGKAAIAAHVMPMERDYNLWPPKMAGSSWYEFLLNSLDDHGEFADNQLGVVTFNYDRSLEHYLYTALCTRRGDEERAAADLSSIEIVHVHGSLGEYPIFGREGQPYKALETPEAVIEAASRILILSEADDDTKEFARARELLDQAERIIFLGFGYHSESLRRLGPWSEDTRGDTYIIGTREGIPDRQWNRLVEPFNRLFRNIGSAKIYPFLTAWFDFAD